ncbi:TrkH family potassium uptake protein [Shimia ponticola]|uniref:TrkH family potassium uptake protein n=1 Tax=Shimia ponticola TaxID=2582893 RepID=UPI00164BD7C8|nr:TrkH family potassium uptake protein [Shimia ponticola]
MALLSGTAGLVMLIPTGVALNDRDYGSAQAFFYSALLTLIVTAMVAIVTRDNRADGRLHKKLFSLLGGFLFLPLLLAVPFYESIGNTTFVNAYFEMMSALTTTGSTVYDAARLSPAEHLWRGLVAWFGGLLMWSAALAVFSPLSLGGYELAARSTGMSGPVGTEPEALQTSERLVRAIADMAPIYLSLTAVLTVFLLVAGEVPLTAVIHSMSTMATAGISPVGGVENGASGRLGELAILLFLIFAVSRVTFAKGVLQGASDTLRGDPEIRLAASISLVVVLALYLRQLFGAVQSGAEVAWFDALVSIWGTLFTVVSFLTTTGFVSADWIGAQAWSQLEAPGLLLMALAMIGGGVATTAGGIKLLRVYALIKHGQREIGRLIHPSSVGGAGRYSRQLRKEGAFIAWVVLMLFLISLSAIMLVLSAMGVGFEPAMILTVATLTNTGPLVEYAASATVTYAALPSFAKLVLCLAMAVGRIETLALIALFNPQFWRS